MLLQTYTISLIGFLYVFVFHYSNYDLCFSFRRTKQQRESICPALERRPVHRTLAVATAAAADDDDGHLNEVVVEVTCEHVSRINS